MKTYKEFVEILERFKPFPEDTVSRQIERKRRNGSEKDSHRMKVVKNFMTKSDSKNHGKRAIDTIRKNTYAAVHKNDDSGKNYQNVDVISSLVKSHTKKSKLNDLDQQSDFNKSNKETKRKLNRLYQQNENS